MGHRDIILKLHVWIPYGKIADAYFWGNIPEFSPDGINLNFKLLPLYANEVIICKFGLFLSANSNSKSLENLEGGWVRWEEVEIRAGSG